MKKQQTIKQLVDNTEPEVEETEVAEPEIMTIKHELGETHSCEKS